MNTYVHNNTRLPYANASGSTITAGSVVELATGTSGYIGIAVADIANGSTGEVEVKGVHVLPKNAGEVFTVGQVLYWDASVPELTGTSTSIHSRAGRCALAAASAATTANVSLNE